jgi:two-component system chemotaxis response regulator CheB
VICERSWDDSEYNLMDPESLRILVVDDSRIFRDALETALEGRTGLRVVGSVWNGEKAIEFVRQSPPDLVTLDLNMPGRGGLDTLSDIQEFNASRPDRPRVGVLLVSALTERGAAVTVEGLERGAFDFIKKPDGPDEKANAALLRQQLLEKIDLFALRRGRPSSIPIRRPEPAAPPPLQRTGRFQAVAIGSSTGGPEALVRVLPVLTRQACVPLFIVQHFPQGMTRYFAESLGKKCDYRVAEASDGEAVQPRTAYIAPGGRHMIVRKHDGRILIALNDQPPENGCRPSVDVLFRSVAAVYPQAVIAIILTGMGCDGAKGLGPLKRSGAYVIAQDEATSVVWGMPGAAVATNQVDETLPLEAIGPKAASLLGPGTAPCT